MEKKHSTRESFLKPEVQSGFEVSVERKLLWKSLLDMYEIVTRVCDQNRLSWWAVGGTLLGAVRHGGIIPWDEDIDLAMPREDYVKLQQLLPDALPKHLFMQTGLTDPEFCPDILRIRDARMSFIDPEDARFGLRVNMGLLLDIFPLDGVPSGEKAENYIMRKAASIYRLRHRAFRRRNKKGQKRHVFQTVFRSIVPRLVVGAMGTKWWYNAYTSLFSRNRMESCERCAISPACFGFKRFSAPTSAFRETIELPFEYLTAKIPKDYDAVLTGWFGDWRTPVRDASCHEGWTISATEDFKSVLKAKWGYSEVECAKMKY